MPGLDLDVAPTCQNYVPAVSLNEINCADHDQVTSSSPWVYCVDAYCLPPVDGFSDCYCWIQEASDSIGPGSATSGASCVIADYCQNVLYIHFIWEYQLG